MRTCTKCLVPKDEQEFSFRNVANNKRQPVCKACTVGQKRKYYEANTEAIKLKANISNKDLMIRNAQYVFDYLKTQHCVICGESDPVVLEFDHRDPSTKTDNVSTLIAKSISIERIQAEIYKCDVQCANCHRRKTAKQFNWFRYVASLVN